MFLDVQKNDVALEEIEVGLHIEEELLIRADLILLPLDDQLKFLEEEVRVVLMEQQNWSDIPDGSFVLFEESSKVDHRIDRLQRIPVYFLYIQRGT